MNTNSSQPGYNNFTLKMIKSLPYTKYIYTILLIQLCAIKLFAQSIDSNKPKNSKYHYSYNPGTIFTKTDTIRCFIAHKQTYYTGRVKYKIRLEDEKLLKLRGEEIMHLKFDKGKSYDRVYHNGMSLLMLKLIEGDVNLYQYVFSSGGAPGGMMPNGAMMPSSPVTTGRNFYLVKKKNIYRLSRVNFRSELKRIFTDSEKYAKLIDEIKYSDFIENIEDYVWGYNQEIIRSTKIKE